MFNLPEGRKIELDEIKTSHEKGTVEDCEEIQSMYHCIEKLIDASDDNDLFDGLMKSTLNSHRRMIESREDWDMCQKTVRRRRLIAMWHNSKIAKDKTE